MAKTRQLRLPNLRKVKRVKKKRQSPQPRVARFRIIKKFELLHRPLDLRFRGRINKWLSHIDNMRELALNKVLDKNQLEIVNLYFYPQNPGNKWLNQEEIIDKTNFNSKKKLRATLVASLVKIWTRTKEL